MQTELDSNWTHSISYAQILNAVTDLDNGSCSVVTQDMWKVIYIASNVTDVHDKGDKGSEFDFD